MWTGPDDVAARLRSLWERGRILEAEVAGRALFPLRIPLKGPKAAELAARFAEVRDWIALLEASSAERGGKGYRLEYRSVQSRRVGHNRLPAAVVIDTLADAVHLLRRGGELKKFQRMLRAAEEICPAEVAYLERKGVRALELEGDFEALLRTALWVFHHPAPGIYPRQIDLPGIDTKFLERHCKTLSEMIDALDARPGRPPALQPGRAARVSTFCRKYGFLSEPLYVKFRVPPGNGLFPPCATDLSLPAAEFAALSFPEGAIRSVFVVENKVNYLSFPQPEGALVIWGAGYSFDHIAAAGWLDAAAIHYWGDIDTNGFAILDQFRARFSAARSFLMDRATLLAHKPQWVTEDAQRTATLPRLTDEEREVYAALLEGKYGERVRLEQERIAFGRVVEALSEIAPLFEP